MKLSIWMSPDTYDRLNHTISFLKSSYLTPGQAYYEGTSVSQVYTVHYCPGCSSSSIKEIGDGLFSKVSSVL